MATGYIRRELGAGEVQFIVATIPWGTVVIPAGAALLFIYAVSQVFPWMPAVITVGVGGALFFWLRIRLKRRVERMGTIFVASPTGLIVGDRAIPRALIQELTWLDSSRRSAFPEHSATRRWNTSVTLYTVDRQHIPVAGNMEADLAQRLASELGQALGGVPVSGGRARGPAGEI